MRTHQKTLHELFDRSSQYCVPLFQRAYVWSQEKQWEPLWLDILKQAESSFENSGFNRNDNDERKHFLGAIVSQRRDTYGLEVPKSEIIDGQQRLVTFQIIFAACRDFVREIIAKHSDSLDDNKLEQVYAYFRGCTRNEGTKNAEHEKYKVWPASADRGAFESVIDEPNMRIEEVIAEESDKTSSHTDQHALLEDAYSYFHQSIKHFCCCEESEHLPDIKRRILALYTALRYSFVLVHIELERDDDPQVIFESLNARGEPLLPSDLIRNYIFMRAAAQGININSLYEKLWKEYDVRKEGDQNGKGKLFWKQMDRYGRTKIKRIDSFIFHYLQSQMVDKEVSINHLYWTFREWWKCSKFDENFDKQLSQMMDYSKMFEQLVVPTEEDTIGRFAHRLKTLETTTVFPLLLHLLARQKDGHIRESLDGIVIDIESYVVRRYVCGLSPKNYNKFFRSLLSRIHEKTVDREIIQRILLDGEGDTSVWPDDVMFKEKWLSRSVFNKHNSKRVGMILSAINDCMLSEKSEFTTIGGRRGLTVEHILPQEWDDEKWPLSPNSQYKSHEERRPEETRNRLLNTFGNLTLLTGKLNSSISNAPFVEKKPEVVKHSYIPMNGFFTEKFEWSESSIVERGEELFNYAKKIWARPERS